jgi:hypothetical protein
MSVLSSIVVSIVGYLVLLYISVYLTGMVVRGLFVQDTDFEDFLKKGKPRPYTKSGISTGDQIDKRMTILFSVISILFLYLLFRFLNVWAVISALVIIFSRIPDLVWEIKNGKKVTVGKRPKGGIYLVTDILNLTSPFLFWWSVYNF